MQTKLQQQTRKNKTNKKQTKQEKTNNKHDKKRQRQRGNKLMENYTK